MTLHEILESVCKKRGLSIDDYKLEYCDPPPSGKTGPLGLEQTLGEVGVSKLQMEIKKGRHVKRLSFGTNKSKGLTGSDAEIGDAPKAITKRLGPMFFYTPQSACKYQEFTVIKQKQFQKQERVLGIDDKKITNSKSKANDKTKRPERAVMDVTKVWVNPSKANQFFIEFKDKTYKYESSQTDEIVAKITYLLQMKDQDNQRRERGQK